MAPATGPSVGPEAGMKALCSQLDEIAALLRLLQDGLAYTEKEQSRSPVSPPSTSTPKPSAPLKPAQSPLAVLSTASALLRSQATQLSLLSLTAPFTPTALTSVLRTFTKILPAFAAAAEDLSSDAQPDFLRVEVRQRVRALYAAVSQLVGRVPKTGEAQRGLEAEDEAEPEPAQDGDDGDGFEEADEQAAHGVIDARPHGKGGGAERRKKVLRGTGVIWAGCAWFEELNKKGAGWLAMVKVKSWQALAEDAVEELDDWAEGEDGESGIEENLERTNLEDGDEDEEAGEEACSSALRPVAKKTVKQLQHALAVYDLVRARLSSSVNSLASDRAVILDSRLDLARYVSDATDEVAAALYDGDEEAVEEEIKKLGAKMEKMLEACAVDGTRRQEWVDKRQSMKLVGTEK